MYKRFTMKNVSIEINDEKHSSQSLKKKTGIFFVVGRIEIENISFIEVCANRCNYRSIKYRECIEFRVLNYCCVKFYRYIA